MNLETVPYEPVKPLSLMKLKIALPLAEKSSVFSIIMPLKLSSLEEYLRLDLLFS